MGGQGIPTHSDKKKVQRTFGHRIFRSLKAFAAYGLTCNFEEVNYLYSCVPNRAARIPVINAKKSALKIWLSANIVKNKNGERVAGTSDLERGRQAKGGNPKPPGDFRSIPRADDLKG